MQSLNKKFQIINKTCNSLKNKTILDIGCGVGILAESLQKEGAIVSGLDASSNAINIAKIHQNLTSQNSINKIKYFNMTIEKYLEESNTQEQFDIITSMEVIEHVNNPEEFIKNISKLIKQNGFLFISTINRTVMSYLVMIFLAENIMKILPKGTHNWYKFIDPQQLIQLCNAYHLHIISKRGHLYNILNDTMFKLSIMPVNYILGFQKTN